MKAWNDNHDNPEQHNTNSYFDTSKEFENMFFRFESCNDDEYFEAKKDEFNEWKNLMCIVRLITKDRNTQLGDGYLVKI